MPTNIPENAENGEPVTLVFIDSEAKKEVDLRFLPIGSHFISTLPNNNMVTPPRKLVIVSADPQKTIDVATRWLQTADTVVEIVWNPAKRPHLASALINISQSSPFAHFRVINETAHLTLCHFGALPACGASSNFNKNVANMLEEKSNENVRVPASLFQQILWRHTYLVKHIGELLKKQEDLSSQLEKIETTNTKTNRPISEGAQGPSLDSENKALRNRVLALERSLSTLEAKYESLSTSKLGSLTLKYWARRRR